MKNRNEVMDFIVALEKEFPVDNWTVGDFFVWPIVRRELYLQLVKQIDQVDTATSSSKGKAATFFSSLIATLRSAVSVVALFLKPTKANYIFSGSFAHRVDFKGILYNRYFDPIMDYAEVGDKTTTLVEYSAKRKDGNYYKPERIIYFTDYVPFFRLRYKIQKRRQKVSLSRYEEFLSCINSHQLVAKTKNRFSISFIEKTVDVIRIYADVFKFIFARYKPSVAFGLCYYNLEMLAMNYASEKCGVKSVDMQHGGQGPLHFAYARWTKMPRDTFDVLPLVFWCWDDMSASTISEWTKGTRHKVIVGGNPWLSLLNTMEAKNDIPANTILYTMQPIGELLDPYILRAIKKTKSIYSWWLRLHPRQLDRKMELVALLEAEGLAGIVNINEAFSMPLPYIMNHSLVHISKFSGSIQESAILGVPTIIIHPLGQQAFVQLINSGHATVCLEPDEDELLNTIQRISIGRRKEATWVDFRSALETLLG